MKLLTVMLLSSLFVGANFEAVADGIDPEIEVFENYEYVKTFYKKLVKDNNIDTAFKFKQKALNGVLLALYGAMWKNYFVVTQDKVFSEHYKYYLEKEKIEPLHKDCMVIKDEVDITVLRCVSSGEFVFWQFKNDKVDGTGSIESTSYYSGNKEFDKSQLRDLDVFFGYVMD